jgi:hypothetical protein
MAQDWRERNAAQDARVLRRCVPLLASLAALSAGESLVIEAPGRVLDLSGGGIVTIAGQGFVARQGDLLLTGEALRWDQRGDRLWASGGIVLVMPMVRLHAERIGLRPGARTGDAWGVEAWIEKGDVRLRIKAERVELRPDRLTFRGVETDFGHGGTLSMHCPILHVHLREQERTDKGKGEIDRFVEGIEAVRPTVRFAGVPVLWFPYLYRDYLLDYPWSTIEVGESKRLGSFLHYRVGSNLPMMGGWRTRIEARADRNTRAGNGFGAELFWKHEDWGRGGASLYSMAKERVADPANQGIEGGEREVQSWDFEHYVSGTGWAASARFTVLPDADPSQTLPAGRSPDERFRADHQTSDLEEKPFARQGLAGAWVTPWLAFTAYTEHRANEDLDETERLLGAEISLPRLTLAGPVAINGWLRAERLAQEVRDTEASRAAWEGRLGVVQWVGGLAFDVSAGVRGVAWSDGRLAGSEVAGTSATTLPFGEAGVRLRLLHDGGAGTAATISPRLGFELLGDGHGAGNPGYDFGDQVDSPETDRQYGITSLDGDLVSGAAVFSGGVTARWGLRQSDREAVEVDGSVRESSSALADLVFSARGSPHPDIEAVADATYDARLARWTAFDVRSRWQVAERVELLYNGAYVPPTALADETWTHRAGGALQLNRYRLDLWGEARPGGDDLPGGRSLDLWHLGMARRMVDGLVSLGYDNAYDPTDTEAGVDHRISVTFVVGSSPGAARDPVRQAFGF